MHMYTVPVHEIYQHLRIFLVLFHLHCVRQDHVQVKYKVLDLVKKQIDLALHTVCCFPKISLTENNIVEYRYKNRK